MGTHSKLICSKEGRGKDEANAYDFGKNCILDLGCGIEPDRGEIKMRSQANHEMIDLPFNTLKSSQF